MPKMFCIATQDAGTPLIDFTVTPVYGWILVERIGTFGAYLMSGTAAQLQAVNALSNVVGIVGVTESGGVRWAELDGVIAAAVRTKLNTWLEARGYPTIPAGWTYRQVVLAVYKRFHSSFDIGAVDIAEPG